MRFSVKHSISKAACLLGLLAAAFTQTGCAHPVMVQPSVMIQPQVGYPQVYGSAYSGASVVVMPRVVPQMVYSAPVYAQPVYRPVYGFSYGGRGGWGHGGHEGHGGRGGWRR
jgi:hypothetical protein